MTTRSDTDTVVQGAVVEELRWTPSVDSDFIDVAVNRGAVTLSGEVDTYPEKRQAERAALRVRGVTAVADHINVRSAASTLSDAMIADAANEALEQSVDVPQGRVTATVHRQQVTLSGSTTWHHQRAACIRAVRALRGVVGVVSDIEVQPTQTPVGVHAAITAALMRSARLEGEGVRVTAVAGDVTLEGQVHTWAERHEAEFAAWSAPGVTNVNNHLQIDH